MTLAAYFGVKNALSNSVLFSSSFICGVELSFVKTLAYFGFIYARDPLL